MKTEKTICAAAMKNEMELLIRKGASEKQLQAITGYALSDLTDPDARLPMATYVQLERAMPTLTQTEAIALHLGKETSHSSQTGVVGHVAASCSVFREGFQQAVRFTQLLSDAFRMELKEENDYARFIYMRDLPEYFTIQGIELALSRTITLMKWIWGTSFQPLEVHFQYKMPNYERDYQKTFGMLPLFQQRENQIVFPRYFLDQKNPKSQPYVNWVMTQHAETLLKQIAGQASLVDTVQRIILEKLSLGEVNIDLVASELNMSRQTLFRKLKEEQGTSFQDLLESTRKHLAKRYVGTSDYTISEITFLMGFSEPSAFHRAFKRWFDVNPKTFRENYARLEL